MIIVQRLIGRMQKLQKYDIKNFHFDARYSFYSFFYYNEAS